MLPNLSRKPLFRKPLFQLLVLALLTGHFFAVSSEARQRTGQASSDTYAGFSALTALPYFMPPLWTPFLSSSLSTRTVKKATPAPDYPTVPYELRDLAVRGDYLYVIYARNGFDIWEDEPVAEAGLAVFTQSPEADGGLLPIARIVLPWGDEEMNGVMAGVDKIMVAGDLAFVFRKYPAVLWIVDCADPEDPLLVNSLILEGGIIADLAIGEENVYLALDEGGDGEESIIYEVSLSSPDELEISPLFSLEGKVGTMLLRQGYLYVFGQYPEGGYVFNVQAADAQELPVGIPDITGESTAWKGNRIYLVTGQTQVKSRLHILDITNPGQPVLQESVNLVGREKQVVLQGEYALVLKSSVFDSRFYVDILDLTDQAASPGIVSTLRLAERPLSMTCDEDCLYLLDNSGLRVADLSDPNDPSWAEPIDLSSRLLAAELENSDHPILDEIPSDTEITTPSTWEFLQGGWFPWSPWSLFGTAFSPWTTLSKGYGPVANSSLYGFSGVCGPWLGSSSSSYSGSGSYSYARGVVNLLDGGGGSSSSACDFLTFPFGSFSSSFDPFSCSLFPPPSVSFFQ
ncbi:MAG: hypothetical protein AB1611_10375 [bacterium]